MSGKVSGMVWELDIPHGHAWVLMSLADHAEHDGSRVYPGHSLTAWKTGYSVRQVKRIVAELWHEYGLIEPVTKGGGSSPAEWRICLEAFKRHQKEPMERRGAKNGNQNARKQTGDTMTPVTPENKPVTPTRARVETSRETSVPPTEAKQVFRSEEDWPGDDAPTSAKQSWFIAYLVRRLSEREVLEDKPMTPSYRKQLAGELATHLNKGFSKARILFGLDYVVNRWRDERVGLSVGLDRAEGVGKVRHLSAAPEPHRPRKRVI